MLNMMMHGYHDYNDDKNDNEHGDTDMGMIYNVK